MDSRTAVRPAERASVALEEASVRARSSTSTNDRSDRWPERSKSLPFALIGTGKCPVYHIVRSGASFWSDLSSPECRHDVAREQLQPPHDVSVRHAGEEHPADEMGHAVLLDEAPDALDALFGPADDEPVLHQLVQVGRDRGVDEWMAPAAGILAPVGHHDVLLGQLARSLVGVGDDH